MLYFGIFASATESGCMFPAPTVPDRRTEIDSTVKATLNLMLVMNTINMWYSIVQVGSPSRASAEKSVLKEKSGNCVDPVSVALSTRIGQRYPQQGSAMHVASLVSYRGLAVG